MGLAVLDGGAGSDRLDGGTGTDALVGGLGSDTYVVDATGDGIVMAEIRPGRRSLADLARSLEACGTPAAQIRESVDRLVEKGLVDALPLPGSPGAPA